MPLGRLTTWALVHLAGRPTALPLAAALQGPLAALAAAWLLYLFVRRELGHPLYGLIALLLFGVSSAYEEAVSWFSASFSVLAVSTLLLALLAAQAWRRTRRGRYLFLSAVAASLAPAWFASGILAGPLCVLYLLPREPYVPSGLVAPRAFWRHHLFALVPLAGSLAFLAVSLPRTAERIMRLEHYAGKSALEAIHPTIGIEYTAHSLVDNLIPGALGMSGVVSPNWVVLLGLVALVEVGAWWWRGAPSRRLLLLGLGSILGSYWLVYSARAEWPYDAMKLWTRYHLLPHLGLVLFICGGLPRWERWLAPGRSQDLSPRQALVLAGLAAALLACQTPRAVLTNTWRAQLRTEQMAYLRLIEHEDAVCREQRISGEMARWTLKHDLARRPEFMAILGYTPDVGFPACVPWKALLATTEQPLPGWLQITGCPPTENGWDFVRGSDRPRPDLTVAEAGRLLDP
jgi:hypothetical protein